VRKAGGDHRESDQIIASPSICEYRFDLWVCHAGDCTLGGTLAFINVNVDSAGPWWGAVGLDFFHLRQIYSSKSLSVGLERRNKSFVVFVDAPFTVPEWVLSVEGCEG
jgi:hypothetical protein